MAYTYLNLTYRADNQFECEYQLSFPTSTLQFCKWIYHTIKQHSLQYIKSNT